MQPDSITPVFRFAPSPNGYLHLGHAYSALLNARMAAESGGRFLVRIEDIDTTRCTEALVQACFEDMEWLGLEWETPVLRQSRESARYQAATLQLEEQGLLYPCFCSRMDIQRAAGPVCDPDGAPLYPGTCARLCAEERAARLASGHPFAKRLDMARAQEGRVLAWHESGDWRPFGAHGMVSANPTAWGDVVLVRKDIPTSYHLSVVLDDAMQGVTHVVRGGDLYEATAIHRLLQERLGLKAPVYHHHQLLRDEAGQKLAKSAASKPLRALRAEGVSAGEIRRRLGFG